MAVAGQDADQTAISMGPFDRGLVFALAFRSSSHLNHRHSGLVDFISLHLCLMQICSFRTFVLGRIFPSSCTVKQSCRFVSSSWHWSFVSYSFFLFTSARFPIAFRNFVLTHFISPTTINATTNKNNNNTHCFVQLMLLDIEGGGNGTQPKLPQKCSRVTLTLHVQQPTRPGRVEASCLLIQPIGLHQEPTQIIQEMTMLHNRQQPLRQISASTTRSIRAVDDCIIPFRLPVINWLHTLPYLLEYSLTFLLPLLSAFN